MDADLIPDDYEESPYASHHRALLRVMLRFRPRTILETGSGLYSIRFLLAFDIDRLVSIENDPDWQVETGDPRHELIRVEGRVADHLPDLSPFDLVFVDDDPVEERVATLKRVIRRTPCPIVAHDADHELLHPVLRDRPNYTDSTRPMTTVLHPRRNKEFARWLRTL